MSDLKTTKRPSPLIALASGAGAARSVPEASLRAPTSVVPPVQVRGAGVWASAAETASDAVKAVAANKAKARPRGRTEAAKIRKFIAENPF